MNDVVNLFKRVCPALSLLIAAAVASCATTQQEDSDSLAVDQQEGELLDSSESSQASGQSKSNAGNSVGQISNQESSSGGNFAAETNPEGETTGDDLSGNAGLDRSNSANINSFTGGDNDLTDVNIPNQSPNSPSTAPEQGNLNTTPLNLAAQSNQNTLPGAPTNSIGEAATASETKDLQVSATTNLSAQESRTSVELGHPHGVLSWVGYTYNKDEKKLDVQIVTEGSPIYRVFKEKNRAGQDELVIRYLNTRLRSKLRRDIDATEFRSPVAYVRMRQDVVFNHTDIILTMRDNVEPSVVNKGSSLMLTFAIPERWFSPASSEVPVATAEIVEDAPVEALPVIDNDSPSADGSNQAYVDNPGKDKFRNVDPQSAKKLAPKSEGSKELVPVDAKEVNGDQTTPVDGGEQFLRLDSIEEIHYSIRSVAQADFATDIPGGEGAAAGLIEDMPLDLTAESPPADSSSAAAGAANQLPAPSTAQPAGTDVLGVESGAPAAVSSNKKVMQLDFREAPVSQIIKMIAAQSNINFVISPEAGMKKTSISLKNVSWDVALKAVLEANQLGMQEISNGLVRIDFVETFAKDHEARERAKQATEALIPTKVMVMALSYLKADLAAQMVKEMLPKADLNNATQQRSYARFKVQPDLRSNAIVVEATPVILATIKTLLERLDRPTPQVRIQSRLVEFSKTNNDGLGVKWGMPFNLDAGRGLGFGSLPFPNSISSAFAIDPPGGNGAGGSLALRLGSINNFTALDLKLKAYEDKKIAETLQTQDVVVQDNEEATVAAGTEDIFPGGVGQGGAQLPPLTVKYELELKVTPHITADGAVQMKLSITGDSPKDPAGTTLASKNTRSLVTTLLKRSGETAVIGGLYSSEVQNKEAGVPIISRIPIIGALFRSKDYSNAKKDLLIMITPTILGSSSASADGATTAAEVPTIDASAFDVSNPAATQSGQSQGQNSQQSQSNPPAQSQGNMQQSGQSLDQSSQNDVL